MNDCKGGRFLARISLCHISDPLYEPLNRAPGPGAQAMPASGIGGDIRQASDKALKWPLESSNFVS